MPLEPGLFENALMEEIVPGTYDIKLPFSLITELIVLGSKDPNALREIIPDSLEDQKNGWDSNEWTVVVFNRLEAYKNKKRVGAPV